MKRFFLFLTSIVFSFFIVVLPVQAAEKERSSYEDLLKENKAELEAAFSSLLSNSEEHPTLSEEQEQSRSEKLNDYATRLNEIDKRLKIISLKDEKKQLEEIQAALFEARYFGEHPEYTEEQEEEFWEEFSSYSSRVNEIDKELEKLENKSEKSNCSPMR